MTSARILIAAIALGPLMLRCLRSKRYEADFAAVLVMGQLSATATTSNSFADSSFPPGALASSLTEPRTITAASLVALAADVKADGSATPFFTETCTYPDPSLTWTKMRPPTVCLRATQPRTSTCSPGREPASSTARIVLKPADFNGVAASAPSKSMMRNPNG